MADGGLSAVMLATAAVSAAGAATTTVMSGQAQKQQAEAAADQATREATAQDAQAASANRATIGQLAAVYGASNVDFGSGSAQVIAKDINARFERNSTIRMGEANRYAESLKSYGKSALLGSYIQAGSGLLGFGAKLGGGYIKGQRQLDPKYGGALGSLALGL